MVSHLKQSKRWGQTKCWKPWVLAKQGNRNNREATSSHHKLGIDRRIEQSDPLKLSAKRNKFTYVLRLRGGIQYKRNKWMNQWIKYQAAEFKVDFVILEVAQRMYSSKGYMYLRQIL